MSQGQWAIRPTQPYENTHLHLGISWGRTVHVVPFHSDTPTRCLTLCTGGQCQDGLTHDTGLTMVSGFRGCRGGVRIWCRSVEPGLNKEVASYIPAKAVGRTYLHTNLLNCNETQKMPRTKQDDDDPLQAMRGGCWRCVRAAWPWGRARVLASGGG